MTHKQTLFVSEYIKSGNATKAAELAGYSPKTARSIGNRLLTNVDIQKVIWEKQQKAGKEADVTLKWWLEKVKHMAEKAAKDSDRAKALDMIGKHLGAYTNELSIIQKMSDEDLDNVVSKLMDKID